MAGSLASSRPDAEGADATTVTAPGSAGTGIDVESLPSAIAPTLVAPPVAVTANPKRRASPAVPSASRGAPASGADAAAPAPAVDLMEKRR
jgi:hypothetical protein